MPLPQSGVDAGRPTKPVQEPKEARNHRGVGQTCRRALGCSARREQRRICCSCALAVVQSTHSQLYGRCGPFADRSLRPVGQRCRRHDCTERSECDGCEEFDNARLCLLPAYRRLGVVTGYCTEYQSAKAMVAYALLLLFKTRAAAASRSRNNNLKVYRRLTISELVRRQGIVTRNHLFLDIG